MLQEAIALIDGCQSLDELRAVWSDHSEEWKALPVKDAAVILGMKESKKKSLISICRWLMESHTLGWVSLVYDPKQPDLVMVDDVPYHSHEVKALMEKGLAVDDLRAAHEVKKTFQGEVMK